MPSQKFKDVKKGLPSDFPVLEANEGDSFLMDVDVGPMTIPYSVAFDGKIVMFGFTDTKETVTLRAGVHTLSWTFQHTAKGWKHKLGAKVGKKASVTLDEKSEAKKDNPASVGLAFVVANAAAGKGKR